MARKRWSVEEKKMIVLELLTTNQPLAEIEQIMYKHLWYIDGRSNS